MGSTCPRVSRKPCAARFEFLGPGLGELPKGQAEAGHFFTGEAVGDVQAALLRFYQVRTPEDLQMLRRIGDGLRGLSREGFHGAWSLGEKVEQLKPPWTRDRLAGLGL